MKSKNRKFRFTENNIQRIISLNLKLEKEEKRILQFAKELHTDINNKKKEKLIDDHNFRSRLSVFSKDALCNKRNKVEEGNPIWEDVTYTLFNEHINDDDSFYIDNWNELPADHPLRSLFFCYSMHCIYSHSHLSWQDIIDIDFVDIALKVDYQFLIEK